MFKGWRKTDRSFFNDFEKEFEEIEQFIGRLSNFKGQEPIIYGYRAIIGPDGVPHVERFGNVPTANNMLVAEKNEQNTRDPYASSIIDEKNNELNITVEMPGIEKENIQVEAAETEVSIRAQNGDRKYFKNIMTPAPVDPESASAKYNNGVLEVTLKLREPVREKGKKIKVQ